MLKSAKQFSSDIAHELYTPISELRVLANVGKNDINIDSETKTYFKNVPTISEKMSQIVKGLRQLTSVDQGNFKATLSRARIKDLVDEVWDGVQRLDSTSCSLTNDVSSEFRIETDENKFGIIVKNLIQNANTYSSPTSNIKVSAQPFGNQFAFTITNQAVEIQQEDLQFMKDRFWRKTNSRSESQHSGLGLSIVDSLATFLNMTVDLEVDRTGKFSVTIVGKLLSY